MTELLEAALDYAARGWWVFPCGWDKRPLTKHGFQDASTDPEQLRAWWKRWSDATIGLDCGRSGLVVIDLDCKNGQDGLSEWRKLGIDDSQSLMSRTPSGGMHLVFQDTTGGKIRNSASKVGPGIDVRGAGGYIIAPPSMIATGQYQALEPWDRAPGDLPQALAMLLTRPEPQPAAPGSNGNGHQPSAFTDAGDHWLEKALARSAAGSRNDTGLWLACQLRDANVSKGEAESVMQAYARRSPAGDHPYSESEALASLAEAFQRSAREPARGNGRGAISYANQGLQNEPPGDFEGYELAAQLEQDLDEKIHLTDQGNARRFALQHAGKVRYVQVWGWLVWNGKKWEIDEMGLVERMAKQTVKRLYREAERAMDQAKAAIQTAEQAQAQEQTDVSAVSAAVQAAKDASKLANSLLNWALKSQDAHRRAAMVGPHGAQSEPEITARHTAFDQNPWFLNVQNGLLDLRTGELKPHDPGVLVTKIAGAAYDPGAACPTWLAFLDRIFAHNQELIDFIQRAAGYSLTGNVGEQCLFFGYGCGANGKSTLMNVLQAMLGDYARKTPTDTLMVKYQDSAIPNDVARLAGARLVIAAELAEGKRLNESLIKDLTGGDVITARYLRREYFEFSPVFKLWMYGNHKPRVIGTDEGIWRRIKLIPFDVVIPQYDRDPGMLDKLLAELDGILTWSVQGCQGWQREGLKPTLEVETATAEFRAEQDLLAAFIDECCIISPMASATAGDLYRVYRSWATESGLEPMSKISLSKRLAERGWTTKDSLGKTKRNGSGQAYITGLGLVQPAREGENL